MIGQVSQTQEVSATDMASHIYTLDPAEHLFRIAGPVEGLRLFVRCLSLPSPAEPKGAVLYIHGMSFPSALSVAWRLDGRSWRDTLCESGFEVWSLDFYGYGGSDRYFEMSQPPNRIRPWEASKRQAGRSNAPCDLSAKNSTSRGSP
jgi:hypothetical protein